MFLKTVWLFWGFPSQNTAHQNLIMKYTVIIIRIINYNWQSTRGLPGDNIWLCGWWETDGWCNAARWLTKLPNFINVWCTMLIFQKIYNLFRLHWMIILSLTCSEFGNYTKVNSQLCLSRIRIKSNNRVSRRSIQVLFSLYSIGFNPS